MSDGPVVITQRDIYEMLLDLKRTFEGMAVLPSQVRDHEDRLREIEAREDLTRRVTGLEASVADIQRKVWALPGAATVIAGAALIFTLIRAY